MGSSPSVEIPPPPLENSHFAITFRHPDIILAVYCPAPLRRLIRDAIRSIWEPGMYEEGVYRGSAHRYKLNDSPFMKHSTFEQAVMIKKLTCKILTDLYNSGWLLVVASDLSRYNDLTTWFFHKSKVEVTETKSICCVSLSSRNKLQLINTAESLEAAASAAIKFGYSSPGKVKRREMGALEFELDGAPWFSDGQPAMDARRFLAELIRQFELCNHRFYGTANLKGHSDSLYFIGDSISVAGQFFVLCLARGDRIRVIGSPEMIIKITAEQARLHWQQGIQGLRSYCGAWECKLVGSPWLANGSEEVIAGRVLINRLFEAYAQSGWLLHCTLDVTRCLTDKSVFIFRNSLPRPSHFSCISFNATDLVRLINFSASFDEGFWSILATRWIRGLSMRNKTYHNAIEYALSGGPWSAHDCGGSGLHVKALLCVVLNLLENHGYRVASSADVSAKYLSQNHGPDYPLDVHSWFVVKDETTKTIPSRVVSCPVILHETPDIKD